MKAGLFRGVWRDPSSRFALLFIVLITLSALLAYAISPVKTSNANEMLPELALQPPGSKATLLQQRPASALGADFMFNGKAPPVRTIVIRSYKEEAGQLYYLPIGYPDREENWRTSDPSDVLVVRTFWLGTDRYGRDLLSRLLIGSRISLSVGLVAVVISLLIGIPLGALAGYYGGRIDAVIQWFLQVVWSIPTLLLVIAITLALGKGFWQVFVAIGLTMWVEVARVVRGEVMRQSKMDYVDAARVLGLPRPFILAKHILPNALSPLIVVSAANFAAAILVESGLSFLGLGAQPPIPSWGGIIKDHYAYILMGKPWLTLAPGLLIMLLVLSFMILGNRLRDVLDVRANTV